MAQTTFNIVIDKFNDFCSTHKQINSFYSGQNWNFQSGTSNSYPAVILLPQTSTIGLGVINLSFNMFVMDMLNADRSNLDEIFSDTLQISSDIVAYFRDNFDTNGFYLSDDNVSIEPLEEALDDVLAGWMSTINISYVFTGSNCVIPM